MSGSIERTLAGEAELEFRAVMAEAWRAATGIRSLVVPGLLLTAGAVMAALLALAQLFDLERPTPLGDVVTRLTVMLIAYPYMAGAFLLALRHSVGQPVRFRHQFACYAAPLSLVAVGLLQNLVTSLGFMLLILPGIYLSFAFYLALPLKAERDLPIVDCLTTSLRLVNRKLFEVSLLSLASGALMIVGVLSVVGWIWTWPWALMILAIVYRQLAGYGGSSGAAAMEF